MEAVGKVVAEAAKEPTRAVLVLVVPKVVEGRIMVDPGAAGAAVKAAPAVPGVAGRIPTRKTVAIPLTRRVNRVLACWKCIPTVTAFCVVRPITIPANAPIPLCRAP